MITSKSNIEGGINLPEEPPLGWVPFQPQLTPQPPRGPPQLDKSVVPSMTALLFSSKGELKLLNRTRMLLSVLTTTHP